MTEERHTLSDPRPIDDAPESLCWEVDVYRKGVPEPIETLLINDETLPPRVRRGKVVWRLPTEAGKLPNFGTDEKRRIFELFKEKKKNRRKKKQQEAVMKSSPEEGQHQAEEQQQQHQQQQQTEDQPHQENKKEDDEQPARPPPPQQQAVKEDKKEIPTSPTWHRGRVTAVEQQQQQQEQHITQPQAPQPQAPQTASPPPPPPPGFTTPQPKYFTVLPPATSVTAAKIFISIYYPYITAGLSADLLRYYTPTAQKSISIGESHSLATSHPTIAYQIQGLQGTVFSVIGVVAQDSWNQGVHIFITGVCCTGGDTSRHFAHSIGLCKVRTEEKDGSVLFQIQNDALALLSTFETPGTPAAVPGVTT